DRSGQRGRQVEVPDCTSKAGDGRPGKVGREVEHGERTRELLTPVGPVPLAEWSGHQLMLPAREVGVASSRRRKVAAAPRSLGYVRAPQLVEKDRRRPEVGDDVVEDQENDVLGARAAQEMDPEQGSALQVEGAASQLGQPFLELGIAPAGKVLN